MSHLDEGSLQAWLDGSRSGMDEAERAEIADHLAGCEACTLRLAEMEQDTRRVQSLLDPAEPVPGGIPEWGAVVARARSTGRAGKRRSGWSAARWVTGVAAALVLGWFSNDVFRAAEAGRRSPTPSATVAAEAASEADAGATGAGGPGTPAAEAFDRRESPAAEAPATAVARAPVDAERAAAPPPEVTDPTLVSPALSPPAATTFEVAPVAPVQAGSATRVAARTGTTVVRGRVTDEDGRPLAAAQVSVRGTGIGALTNEQGAFELSLPDSAAGPGGVGVTLTARLIGYGPTDRELAARPGDTLAAELRLVQQALALDAMVITGEPASRPSGVESARRRQDALERDATEAPRWTAMARAAAEAWAGFPLRTVPGMRVVDVAVGTYRGTPVARVVQELAGGGRLTLVQARGGVPMEDAASMGAAAGTFASIRSGEVGIAATAPVLVDSLNALLRRVR
jgi:hypothetical protein